MIQKFRKKPVVIEAVQFTGHNFFEIAHFIGRGDLTHVLELQSTDCPVIETLEGNMVAQPEDWVVKGIKGEFYPVKPDIFAATYERVVEELPACHTPQRALRRGRQYRPETPA